MHPELLAAINASGISRRALSTLTRRTGTDVARLLVGREMPVTVQLLDGLRRAADALGYSGALLASTKAAR